MADIDEILDDFGQAYAAYIGIPAEQKWLKKARKKAKAELEQLIKEKQRASLEVGDA